MDSETIKEKLGFDTREYSASSIHPDDAVLLVDARDHDSFTVAADIMDKRGATDIEPRTSIGAA